jgi:hypothetical protein
MKLHKRVTEDLVVVSGEPAGLKGRSTEVTKSGWLQANDQPNHDFWSREKGVVSGGPSSLSVALPCLGPGVVAVADPHTWSSP